MPLLRFLAGSAEPLQPFRTVIAGWIAAERGPGRLLPWLPVAFGSGIAGYFALDREPPLVPAGAVALLLVLLAILLRRRAGCSWRSRWRPLWRPDLPPRRCARFSSITRF